MQLDLDSIIFRRLAEKNLFCWMGGDQEWRSRQCIIQLVIKGSMLNYLESLAVLLYDKVGLEKWH